jgi:hypothetical protein
MTLTMMLMPTLGCGGESERSARRTTDGGAGLAGGSSEAGESSLGGRAAAGAGASAGGSYLPEGSTVPAAGDGRLLGGSFEGVLGNGWDFCFTKNPGALLTKGGARSSDGEASLAFDSRQSCSESFACQTQGDDAQVGFWLETGLPPGVPVHLYFDAVNLGQTSPSGTLQLDVLRSGCTRVAPLATIPLVDLDLTSDWGTRCVSFTPNAVVDVFGLYVTGDAFQLGLDAFRFGPECGN